MIKNEKVQIDNVEHLVEDLSESAKTQLINIQFADEIILQKQNEWAISNTARNGYLNALKAELLKVDAL
jgi:hypothetical protein